MKVNSVFTLMLHLHCDFIVLTWYILCIWKCILSLWFLLILGLESMRLKTFHINKWMKSVFFSKVESWFLKATPESGGCNWNERELNLLINIQGKLRYSIKPVHSINGTALHWSSCSRIAVSSRRRCPALHFGRRLQRRLSTSTHNIYFPSSRVSSETSLAPQLCEFCLSEGKQAV